MFFSLISFRAITVSCTNLKSLFSILLSQCTDIHPKESPKVSISFLETVNILLLDKSKLGVQNNNFHLLRGNEYNDTKNIANGFLSTAMDDPTAPGGIDHSGWILLVDTAHHIRSFSLGTDEKDVNRFIDDIKLLQHEMGRH